MRRGFRLGAWSLLLVVLFSPGSVSGKEKIVIGSKNFTESYVLAEMMAQMIEAETGIAVERRVGLSGTQICFESLIKGEIDAYPEYSGTGTLVILKDPQFPTDDIRKLDETFSRKFGVRWISGFGFENSFALAMRKDDALDRKIRKYSDLVGHPSLRLAFSYEFLNRLDGYPALSKSYNFAFSDVRGMQHDLAWKAIRGRSVDLIDAYSTDGELLENDLVVLEDDKNFFPKYWAAPVVSLSALKTFPRMEQALLKLAGKIDAREMQTLNLEASRAGDEYPKTVARFLAEKGLSTKSLPAAASGTGNRLFRHLQLTAISVLLAALVAIPLGILIRKSKALSSLALGLCGVLQTIPSIAMLGFMLPLFGIGVVPAVAALFLYGLLPILRNTTAGLQAVPQALIEVARGQGLTYGEILRHVELPLATRTILAGIHTSAVINVGTATLAAFIGAGGLGEPIVTGIALHDTKLILSGAIPAALLALAVDGALILAERLALPKGIRQLNRNRE